MNTSSVRGARRQYIALMAAGLMLAGGGNLLAGNGLELQPRAGDPLNGLTSDQLDRFFKGKDQFTRQLTPAEGLGPTFNQNSCSSCHAVPIGGSGTVFVTRFGYEDQTTGEFDPLEHLGGSLLQAELVDGLPGECADEIPDIANITAKRITNSTLGAGLVEAIPDQDLIDFANASATGKVHMVPALEDEPGSPLRAGRMGWKAQVATVLTFSADASRNEMGFTNRFIEDPPAPKGDPDLLAFCDQFADNPNDGPDAEGFHFIDRITDFQRFLAAPPQTPRSGMTGEQIFTNVGCAECHVPSWTTSSNPDLEDALRDRVIKPYSDFLLHDMGSLGDGIEQGDAGQRDIRTPSLWGVRIREELLHDGRVAGGTFAERIMSQEQDNEGVVYWHGAFGSAAAASALAFFGLDEDDQLKVVAFLDSLGRAEFDFDGDNIIDDDDFWTFVDCFTGAGDGSVHPDDHCAIGDIDQDGSIDETDFEFFLLAYEGNVEPCDLWQLLADNVGPGIDVTLPSECTEACLGDLTGDGVVDVSDLLVLLGDWGPCPRSGDCPADLNDDGVVDVSDLLILLGAWGPCR